MKARIGVVVESVADFRTGATLADRVFCTSMNDPIPIVIGLARTKRECWVLAGFDPCSSVENDRLSVERKRLGFDPREQAHRLTAKHDPANDKLSAKRVLSALTDHNYHREAECWEIAELQILRDRGIDSGLTEYLANVEMHLVPIVISRR